MLHTFQCRDFAYFYMFDAIINFIFYCLLLLYRTLINLYVYDFVTANKTS